jgi:hypothetical protein
MSTNIPANNNPAVQTKFERMWSRHANARKLVVPVSWVRRLGPKPAMVLVQCVSLSRTFLDEEPNLEQGLLGNLCGCSRSSVRRAFQVLRKRHLVETKPVLGYHGHLSIHLNWKKIESLWRDEVDWSCEA